jgi:hypothetical protein
MNDLTVKKLREMLDYDPENGFFRWKIRWKRVRIGQLAGVSGPRYARIMLGQRRFYAHRLAWLYVYGVWPQHEIDHIDGDRLNNRISNLREATSSENKRNTRKRSNNTSGFKGVSFDKSKKLWTAQIATNRKYIHIGRFKTPEAAYEAYCAAAERLHGDFAQTT